MRTLFVISIISLLFLHSAYSQTYVSGGIFSNSIWTLANSPYIVTGDLTLFPSYTLTIEPGVVVKFYDNVSFEVRGTLNSSGTLNDSISFVSFSSNPSKGSWKGINCNHFLGGKGSFMYSLIKDADIGIQNSLGFPPVDSLRIWNCKFENNNYGIAGYGGEYATISLDNSYFINNINAISGADKIIRNSTFVYNNYGLSGTERTNIYNCNFCGNKNAIVAARGAMYNSIVMNNGIGVKGTTYGELAIMTGNVIAQNDTGAIMGGYIGYNNTICNNVYYNIVNNTSYDITIINHCWCLTDSTNIANKIYDGYDDPQFGKVSFMPFINCNSSVLPDTSYCPPIPVGIVQSCQVNNYSVHVYPNPFDEFAILEFNNFSYEKLELLVYNTLGQFVISFDNLTNENLRIDRNGLPSGMYFFKLKSKNLIIAAGKFIIK